MSYILKMHMWNFTLNRDFILSDSHEYLLSDYHSADLAIELDAWNSFMCPRQCRSNSFFTQTSVLKIKLKHLVLYLHLSVTVIQASLFHLSLIGVIYVYRFVLEL
jgi:hypothetical protein